MSLTIYLRFVMLITARDLTRKMATLVSSNSVQLLLIDSQHDKLSSRIEVVGIFFEALNSIYDIY